MHVAVAGMRAQTTKASIRTRKIKRGFIWSTYDKSRDFAHAKHRSIHATRPYAVISKGGGKATGSGGAAGAGAMPQEMAFFSPWAAPPLLADAAASAS